VDAVLSNVSLATSARRVHGCRKPQRHRRWASERPCRAEAELRSQRVGHCRVSAVRASSVHAQRSNHAEKNNATNKQHRVGSPANSPCPMRQRGGSCYGMDANVGACALHSTTVAIAISHTCVTTESRAACVRHPRAQPCPAQVELCACAGSSLESELNELATGAPPLNTAAACTRWAICIHRRSTAREPYLRSLMQPCQSRRYLRQLQHGCIRPNTLALA
jgi:hypothetical protein